MFPMLVGAAVKSAVVFALAWLVTKAMRRASAASRHIVWTACAAAVIVLPFFSQWMPEWRVNAGPAWRETAAMFQANSAAPRPTGNTQIAMPAARKGSAPARQFAIPDWTTPVACVWILGTVLALFHMLAGYAAIASMRRKLVRSRSLDGVELLESRAGSMPMAAGIWKPAVFLPADAAEWPEDRRRAVLLHELAHVRRGDLVTQLMGRIALAMYWWNPLAWTAWRESLKERERAADDAVLAAGVDAACYASHLLEVARGMRTTPFAAGVAMARRSQLEGRVLAILDSKASRKSAGRWSAMAAAACAVALMIPLAVVRAQDAAPADLNATFRAAVAQNDAAGLDRVAQAAESQLKFDIASRALDLAAEIVARESGPSGAEYGKAILKKADLEKRAHGFWASAPLYSQAADLLAGKPEQASALINLGEIALHNKDLEAAEKYFSRARLSQPETSAIATMWLARVREQQGSIDQAEALFKSAVALAGPASQNGGLAMTMLAGFLKKQGRDEEARNYFDQARLASRQAASSVPAVKPSDHGPFHIGGEISAPKVVSKVEPGYSEEARLAGLQGTVVLSLVIGEDGVPRDVTVTHSLGMELDDEAISAVTQWKFSPGTRGGEPVPVIATIEVNFHLK